MLLKFLRAFAGFWASYERSRPSRWVHVATLGLSLISAIAVPALALSATAGAILAAPERYDGQSVTLEGTGTHLSERVSQRGNPYYTFDLKDGTGAIRIFSFGKAPCSEGTRAMADGTFEQVKQVGRYTYRNEVAASRVTCR